MTTAPRRTRPHHRPVLWSTALAAALIVTGCTATALPTGPPSPATEMSVTTSAALTPSASPSATPSSGGSTADPSSAVPTAAPTAARTAAPTAAEQAAALLALGTLPVQDPAPHDGYTRAQFGQAWSDDVTVDGGHNGCDTRNDILRRDLTAAQIKPGTQGCLVLAGTLADEYTGASIPFVRGASTSEDVQIDHLVPLSNAWQTGAQLLTAAQRQDLANDPLNLQAVGGSVNESKGDGDAAQWLPPKVGYRCTYVSRQIEVKVRYRLWVSPGERDAMATVLADCGEPAPVDPPSIGLGSGGLGSEGLGSEGLGSDELSTAAATPTVAAAPPLPAASDPAPGAVTYKNCAAVRAAGAAPLYRGQPGYSASMDGDGDGIACEK